MTHDAEIGILAACIQSPTARREAQRHLVGSDFDDPRHETIWNAIGTLERHGKMVAPATLLETLRGERAVELLPDIITAIALPDAVADYAAIVRTRSIRRRIESTARAVVEEAQREPGPAWASKVAARFAAIRDGSVSDDITALTISELLAEVDEAPDWVIPGLLERQDRLMLTGEEGLGKSHLLRQLAIWGAVGRHPFDATTKFDPIRALIVDCENTKKQVRRKLRGAMDYAIGYGQHGDRLLVDNIGRIDIRRDKDLAKIHQTIDAFQPDLVVIGPLYRLVPAALQTDDDTAPVLAALDTIRERGAALAMEAHAGHAIGKGNVRDLRPRGSSSLLGWPEFGYGMRHVAEGYADFVPWRGAREERDWPQRLRKSSGFRWLPHGDVYDYGGAA